MSTGDLKTRDNNTNEISYRMVVPLNFCSVTIFNEKSPAFVRPVLYTGIVQSKFLLKSAETIRAIPQPLVKFLLDSISASLGQFT